MSDRRVIIRPSKRSLANLGVALDLTGDVTLTGGLGGWVEISRPRRPTALEWSGVPGRAQVIPAMVNGIEVIPGVDVSIEPQMGAIEAWGLPNSETGDEPPPLTLSGPLPATDGEWVLQEVALAGVSRDGSGARIQQYLTLTLLEFIEPKMLKSPAKKTRHGGGKNNGGKNNGGKNNGGKK